MNDYDIKMATQAEVLLRGTEKMLETVREAQKYVSDMNSNLAFRLWHNVELDLCVFHKMATELKEEYGTPKKESKGQISAVNDYAYSLCVEAIKKEKQSV